MNVLTDEGAAGVHAPLAGEARPLTAFKDQWDPANVFHLNQNIPPS